MTNCSLQSLGCLSYALLYFVSPLDAAYARGDSIALAAHLLHNYSSRADPQDAASPKLSSREIAVLTAFVEDNLDGSIVLSDLAAVLSISRFL